MTKILKDKEGATAVEFALVMPAFTTVVFGIVEISMLMFCQALVETAALEGARYGQTGSEKGGMSRADYLLQVVHDRTMGYVTINDTTVTAKAYPSYAAVTAGEAFDDANGNGQFDSGESFEDANGDGEHDPDVGIAGMGGPGDVVLYRIDYSWSGFTPAWQATVGTISLYTTVAVQNEPWDEQ